MAAACWFCDTPWTTGATVTASGSTGTMTPDNVIVAPMAKVWRCNTSEGWVLLDVGSNVSLDHVILRFPTFDTGLPISATDTIQIRADADGGTPGAGALWDTGGSPFTTSDVVTGINYSCFFLENAISARYLRIDIDAPSRVSDDAFDLSYVWAGVRTHPDINVGLGFSQSWEDGSHSETSDSSSIDYVDTGDRRRVWDIPFNQVTLADKVSFEDLSLLRGAGSLFAFGVSTTDTPNRQTIIGRLRRQPTLRVSQIYGYSFVMSIAEAL